MFTWLAESALMTSPVGGFLKAIPAWAWKWLAIAAALVAAFLLHQHIAHKAIRAAEKRGADAAYANVAKQARELSDKANALNRSLAEQMRKRNDAKLADNHRDAAALRLSGPGAARCTAVSRPSAAAGGHVQAAADQDATGSALPANDLAAVPWGWLTDRAEEHDALLIEDQGWREWYTTFKARWDQWNAEAAKARQPAK